MVNAFFRTTEIIVVKVESSTFIEEIFTSKL